MFEKIKDNQKALILFYFNKGRYFFRILYISGQTTGKHSCNLNIFLDLCNKLLAFVINYIDQ